MPAVEPPGTPEDAPLKSEEEGGGMSALAGAPRGRTPYEDATLTRGINNLKSAGSSNGQQGLKITRDA